MINLFNIFWYKWLGRPFVLKKRIQAGRGSKILVLLHGIADDAETWNPIVSQIDHSKWTVIGLDLLGFGKSPKPDWSDYTVEDHTKAITRTLRLKPRQKITIIGHSMGCIIATHYAYKNPKRIRQLILYEPAFFSQDSTDKSLRNRKRLYFSVYEHIMNNPKMALFYGKLGSKMIRGLSHASINNQTWVSFEKSLKNTVMNQESLNELVQIDSPTDMVYGRFDLIVSKTDIEINLKNKSNIMFHTVTDMHGVSKRSAKYIISILR